MNKEEPASSIIIKIVFRKETNFVKILRHGDTWEYEDFLISASIHANIIAKEIDYFTDSKGVKLNKENFIEIVQQFYQHPDFSIEIVLKRSENFEVLKNSSLSRQNCRIGIDMYINNKDFENYLSKSKNAFVLTKKKNSTEELKGLSDVERRTIIREAVDMLVERFSHHPEPCYITAMASAIVNLFPQLKSSNDTNEIELLYNRQKNRGYLLARLYRVRQKIYSLEKENTSRKQKSANTSIDVELQSTSLLQNAIQFFDFENNDDFLILKNANVRTQSSIIRQKLIDTLELRKNLLDTQQVMKFSEVFPFFFASPELILYDFEIRYPKNYKNFLNKWEIIRPTIKTVFLNTKGPSFKGLPEVDEWLPSARPIFYLLNLLPQHVAGKSSAKTVQDSFNTSLTKLILFKPVNLTNQELTNEEYTHPYLIACGENKLVLSAFYLCVERELIILPSTFDIIDAIDALFKAHYVFGQHFTNSLKTFWNFIANFFYEIRAEKLTTRAKEIGVKLEVASTIKIFSREHLE